MAVSQWHSVASWLALGCKLLALSWNVQWCMYLQHGLVAHRSPCMPLIWPQIAAQNAPEQMGKAMCWMGIHCKPTNCQRAFSLRRLCGPRRPLVLVSSTAPGFSLLASKHPCIALHFAQHTIEHLDQPCSNNDRPANA